MDLRMTKAEREAFLAGVHVAMVSVAEAGRGPLTAPVWYVYEPGGEPWFATGRESRKAKLLEAAGRATLTVQAEAPPYGYVSVEGPVSFADVEWGPHIEAVAHRYLAPADAEAYLASAGGPEGVGASVVVRITPERWLTQDYGKAFG
jgi:PPOX class probable F420-dependent enzyme